MFQGAPSRSRQQGERGYGRQARLPALSTCAACFARTRASLRSLEYARAACMRRSNLHSFPFSTCSTTMPHPTPTSGWLPNLDPSCTSQPRSLMYLFGATRIPTRVGTRMHDTCPGAQLRGRAVHLTSAGSDRGGLRGTDLVSSANVQSHLPGLFPFPTAPDAYPPSSSRVSGALRADSLRVLREECRRVRGRA